MKILAAEKRDFLQEGLSGSFRDARSGRWRWGAQVRAWILLQVARLRTTHNHVGFDRFSRLDGTLKLRRAMIIRLLHQQEAYDESNTTEYSTPVLVDCQHALNRYIR